MNNNKLIFILTEIEKKNCFFVVVFHSPLDVRNLLLDANVYVLDVTTTLVVHLIHVLDDAPHIDIFISFDKRTIALDHFSVVSSRLDLLLYN